LDKIQTKVEEFSSLLFTVTSTALLDISISSNSCNLLDLTVSVKEKVGKPDRKLFPLLYGLRNPYRNTSSPRTLKITPRILIVVVRS
jgi:hypothetical protein